MNGLNRLLLIVSLICEIICLIASIWVSTVLREGGIYLMVVIFAAAVVFTTVTLIKSFQNKK